MRGVPWLYGAHGLYNKTGSELDDDVEFSISTTSEVLHEKTDNIVMELLRYASFSVNWPDLIDTPGKLEELLRVGYQYNNWPVPESWRHLQSSFAVRTCPLGLVPRLRDLSNAMDEAWRLGPQRCRRVSNGRVVSSRSERNDKHGGLVEAFQSQ